MYLTKFLLGMQILSRRINVDPPMWLRSKVKRYKCLQEIVYIIFKTQVGLKRIAARADASVQKYPSTLKHPVTSMSTKCRTSLWSFGFVAGHSIAARRNADPTHSSNCSPSLVSTAWNPERAVSKTFSLVCGYSSTRVGSCVERCRMQGVDKRAEDHVRTIRLHLLRKQNKPVIYFSILSKLRDVRIHWDKNVICFLHESKKSWRWSARCLWENRVVQTENFRRWWNRRLRNDFQQVTKI